MNVRWFCVPLMPLALSACLFGGGGDRDTRPAPRPSPTIRERGSGPITLNLPTSRETQQCFTDLSRADVRYSPLPDRDYGGGCIVTGAVQLLDIGVPVTNLKAITCPAARALTGWVRHAVAPAAAQILKSELVKVETYGTYSCRGIVQAVRACLCQCGRHFGFRPARRAAHHHRARLEIVRPGHAAIPGGGSQIGLPPVQDRAEPRI
jgi:hypothetical protein